MVEVGRGLGHPVFEVPLVRFLMGRPQRGRADALLPSGDGSLVQFEEHPFATVLDADQPGWRTGGQRRLAGRKVQDAVHLVDAGEPEQRCGLTELLDGEHTGDLGRHPAGDLPVAHREPTGLVGVMLAGRVLLEVEPLGDQQVGR